MSSGTKSYARSLMVTSGGIIEIIGLALEFPSALYFLRDACITACKTLEGIPDVFQNGTSSITITTDYNYLWSLSRLVGYFVCGVQQGTTIDLVESMMYGKKVADHNSEKTK